MSWWKSFVMRDVYNAIQHPEMPAPMTDPAFTLEEFAAWLMAQPGDTSFNTDSAAGR